MLGSVRFFRGPRQLLAAQQRTFFNFFSPSLTIDDAQENLEGVYQLGDELGVGKKGSKARDGRR